MCFSWKDRFSRSKLGAAKNGCGVSAFAAPWRSQSRNFGLWSGCWQIKATDLAPRLAIWICSWPPSAVEAEPHTPWWIRDNRSNTIHEACAAKENVASF